MIIIPRQRPIITAGRMHIGMRGFFRIRVWRPDQTLNRPRIDTGWMPNQILTNGRNNMATQANWLTHCRVGTSSVAPSAGDTQLGGQVAATSTVVENDSGTQASAPNYGWRRRTYRYPVGAGQGGENLSEAGVGWASTGSTLISRALIIDPITQVATTITPLADEILDITYELRYYPPLLDNLNSVTLNGTNYDTITRAASVTGSAWSDDIGTAIAAQGLINTWRAFDGTLGSITQDPNGSAADIDDVANISSLSYSNNSYQRVLRAACGINGWNLGAGARCLTLMTSAGAFQTQFSSNPGGNPVPKTINETWTMQWIISWAALNLFGEWDMIAASDGTTPAAGQWNTNLAGSLLRINWEDQNTDDRQDDLQLDSGTDFRITDNTDPTKWVEYSVTGAYTEQTDWTEYPISQIAIQNSGPTVGNTCTLKNMNQ